MNKIKFSIIVLLLLAISAKQNHAQDLELVKVVDVSRHGLRSPLEQYLSTLDMMTGDGYQWTRTPVPGSHLTPQGDTLERYLGEYFRLWLETESFELDSANIYLGASSKQRTVATTKAFASGMLPGIDLPVDYKKKDSTYGYLDPDYLPILNNFSVEFFDTIALKKEAHRELGELPAPSYQYLEDMLRMSRSSYAKSKGIKHFDNLVGLRLDFQDNDTRLEPTMLGGLRDANMASDAFILAFLESKSDDDSLLGRPIGSYDWKALASIKDYYVHILFSKAPIISVNVSHCMLNNIYTEMNSGRKYSFFCTHDSMLEALLAALRVQPYYLANTIESKTPIGVKLLFEVWEEKNGTNPEKYIRVRLVYQSSEQIRGMQRLTLDNPPMSCELSFTGIEKVSNGMYPYDEFMNHLQTSLNAYEATAQGKHPWE